MTPNAPLPQGNAPLPGRNASLPPSNPEAVLRRVVAETVRAATEQVGEPTATSVAAEFGRRVGEALAREGGAPDLVQALGGADGEADAVLAAVADGFVRGFAAAGAHEGAPPTGPAGGDAAASSRARRARAQDLVAATRRAAHDLNQPLTVILGYAAILKRVGTETLRVEAAEHIVKEARKMSEIITTLSRLARGLDAA